MSGSNGSRLAGLVLVPVPVPRDTALVLPPTIRECHMSHVNGPCCSPNHVADGKGACKKGTDR